MKILFVGDIVGRPGRRALAEALPDLIREEKPDAVIVNGENAAGGNGLTPDIYREFVGMGVDGVTLGNHTWDKREILEIVDSEPTIARPANYPPGTPGRGFAWIQVGRERLLLVNLMGRVFSPVNLDDPFRTAETIIEGEGAKADAILVDIHAEATSEKRALGLHLDGKVTAVLGTHTHVMTADLEILPGGTAFMTDVGMTGPKDSVIGVKKELVIEKFLTQRPVRFETASGPWQLNAVLLTTQGMRTKEVKAIRVEE